MADFCSSFSVLYHCYYHYTSRDSVFPGCVNLYIEGCGSCILSFIFKSGHLEDCILILDSFKNQFNLSLFICSSTSKRPILVKKAYCNKLQCHPCYHCCNEPLNYIQEVIKKKEKKVMNKFFLSLLIFVLEFF